MGELGAGLSPLMSVLTVSVTPQEEAKNVSPKATALAAKSMVKVFEIWIKLSFKNVLLLRIFSVFIWRKLRFWYLVARHHHYFDSNLLTKVFCPLSFRYEKSLYTRYERPTF